jgi:PAS domain S-box-containing protein
VDTATSASDGLQLMQEIGYDAIISDFQMPSMDGLEFLSKVRALHGSLPFVLFTGRGREDVAAKAFEMGVDFYVQKGGDPNVQFIELLHKVRSAVDKRQLQADLIEREAMMTEALKMAEMGSWSYVFSTEKMTFSESMFRLMDEPEGREGDPMKALAKIGEEMTNFIRLLQNDAIAQRQAGFSYDYTFKGREGKIRSHHCKAMIQYAPDGRPLKLIGIVQDVTPMLRAQKGMVEASRLHALLNGIADMLFVLDMKGKVRFTNAAVEQMLGYTFPEANGQPVTVFHPPGREQDVVRCIQAMVEGTQTLCAIPYRRKDGTILEAETRMSVGQLAGAPALIGIAREKQPQPTLGAKPLGRISEPAPKGRTAV